jgi:branched-subunit amino acid ABC-type transport system permease component
LRLAILTLALIFTIALGAFTGLDLAHYGVTVPGVSGAFIVVVFTVAIIGALTEPPSK